MAMPVTDKDKEARKKQKRDYWERNKQKFAEYNRQCRLRKRVVRDAKPVKMTAKKLEAWNDLIGAYHV